ncbi:MAG TPA: hypothetical protein DCF33_11605 [Saprospirales bacterium]|nr:hypothetical protein [Saprospirales bacterium]
MKVPIPYSLYLVLFYCIILSNGCYSARKLPATRLQHSLQLEGIQYVAMDATQPDSKIWLLSDITTEEQAFTAKFKVAPDGFGEYVQRIKSSRAQKMNRDFVYIYIASGHTEAIQDQLFQRVEFSQIKKIIVFEPDAVENTGAACLGVGGIALLFGIGYWVLDGFY